MPTKRSDAKKPKKSEERQILEEEQSLAELALSRRSALQAEMMHMPGNAVIEMFLGTEQLGEAIKACGWTPQSEMEILTEIAEDSKVSPSHRLKACEVIHERIKFAMQCSGRIVNMVMRNEDNLGDNHRLVSEMSAIKVVQDAAIKLEQNRNDLMEQCKVKREVKEVKNESRD